ncbi:MAG: agmatine deiminase family protein [bacterium]|nr:agmatine deiminase family protein [bacterium]
MRNSLAYRGLLLLAIALSVVAFTAYYTDDRVVMGQTEDSVSKKTGGGERMLIVLAAPSIHDSYYRKHFNALLAFHTSFAQAAKEHDDLIVLADADTLPRLRGKIPDDQLLEADLADIWMRDFATVHPRRMVSFRYDRPKEPVVKKTFNNFVKRYQLNVSKNELKVDGGNVVDNGTDSAIMTEKVYARNPGVSPAQVRSRIKRALGLKRLAIIPMDDEYLGHSDGMVLWLSPTSVLMNRYQEDPDFTYDVESALRKSLPGVRIHKIPGAGYGEKYGRYASACGIYVNATVTDRAIYVPVFDEDADEAALELIRAHTNKSVVPLYAGDICELGGSARCLSWQLTGENAQKLIRAARKN